MSHPVHQRRVDGVLGHVALDPEVVVAVLRVFGQSASLDLHLVCRLPRAGYDLRAMER